MQTAIKPTNTSKQRVLVVDDDSELLMSLAGSIRKMGWEVATASNGKEALKSLAQNEYSMVLTDVQMPQMSGLDLFQQVRSSGIPVILMTGYSSMVDPHKASEIGVADFLSKPFSTEELQNSLATVYSQSRRKNDHSEDEVESQYSRVYVPDVISVNKGGLDIFVRVGKAQYTRVARADNPTSQLRLKQFFDKGLRFLHVRKDDLAAYVGFNLKLAQNTLRASTPCKPSEKTNFLRQAIDVDLEKLFVPGGSRESFDYGKSIVENALQMAIENDALWTLLRKLQSEHPRVFIRSLGVSMCSALIAKQVGWTSRGAAFKVALAGILHDVGSVGLPAELFLQPRSSLSREQLLQYQSHATRGRDLLREMPFIPEEVIQAVANHHENNVGTGFPLQISRLKLHPMARLIRLADEFCGQLIKGEGTEVGSPRNIIPGLYSERESEFEPVFLRALFEIYNVNQPEKLRKLSSFLDAKG